MNGRNHFIDVAKGIAIILVLFNHYEWADGSFVSTHLYYWLVSMAVPIFMLCTGYVTAASFETKNISLSDCYTKRQLVPKLVRYIMPFVWFYIAETVLALLFEKFGVMEYISTLDFPYNHGYSKKMTIPGTIAYFFMGGRGQHGTYYFPVIIQTAFMIPLIFKIVKKYKYGLWMCFGATILWEIVKNVPGYFNIPFYPVYRLVALRYIFAIALGIYMYLYRDRIKKFVWISMFCVGVVYTVTVCYTSYPGFIYTTWRHTSAFSVMYIAPIIMLGTKYMKNIRLLPLEELGRASYHILMVQILYYNFFAPFVWADPRGVIPNDAVGFLIGFVICTILGYGYYKLYSLVSGMIKKHKKTFS